MCQSLVEYACVEFSAYIAHANVLYHLRIKVALSSDLLQDLERQSIERGILQTALPCLAERCADGECDNDIVGVLRCTMDTTTLAYYVVSSHLHHVKLRGKARCPVSRTSCP